MPETETILVLSDVHFASPAERARVDYELVNIPSPFVRLLVRVWRHYLWLRDPFAHNYLLDRFLEQAGEPHLVVANGDFSCDSAFIGVSDPASKASAEEALGKLRGRFADGLLAINGDHEFGKSSLAGNQGGMRLASFEIATRHLQIPLVWERRSENRVLIGVTSSLIALDAFERDILADELRDWQKLRAEHMEQLREIFARVRSKEKIILFCHDPTALPFLAREKFVSEKLPQFEKTIIGHLHTPMVFWQAKLLAGFPQLHFLGRGIRRISGGLNRARAWKPFRPLLCPSLAGSQLLKDGGYYELRLNPGQPGEFLRRRLRWES